MPAARARRSAAQTACCLPKGFLRAAAFGLGLGMLWKISESLFLNLTFWDKFWDKIVDLVMNVIGAAVAGWFNGWMVQRRRGRRPA